MKLYEKRIARFVDRDTLLGVDTIDYKTNEKLEEF